MAANTFRAVSFALSCIVFIILFAQVEGDEIPGPLCKGFIGGMCTKYCGQSVCAVCAIDKKCWLNLDDCLANCHPPSPPILPTITF
ncbi:hypothetical protein ACFX2B_026990 [Malus domestica]